jgi:CRISPR-associated protein (TIGR02710 family)
MNTCLLIATVGGSPEPLAASLLHWRPARAFLVVSTETKQSVTDKIAPAVQGAGWPDFDAGRYDLVEVSDAQDFESIVAALRKLDERTGDWLRDHPGSEVIADFTGGTKAMTAGLALTAARWPCQISYVGGTERTKDGVGVVVSGKEQIVHTQNPWDALGYLATEQAIVLFNNGNFSAAARLLEATRDRVTDLSRKREFQAFTTLCQICEHWERFQHKDALNKLGTVQRDKNDLFALLGIHRSVAVQQWLVGAEKQLKELAASQTNAPARQVLVRDLLGNAKRRVDQGAYDDAVARLYRALEAIAQARLYALGFEDTGKVLLEKLPAALCSEWQNRAIAGVIKLGLQDDYTLLAACSDDAAARFKAEKLDDPQHSLLVSRNSSILAHGYVPNTKDVAQKLFHAALRVSALSESDVSPVFPAL